MKIPLKLCMKLFIIASLCTQTQLQAYNLSRPSWWHIGVAAAATVGVGFLCYLGWQKHKKNIADTEYDLKRKKEKQERNDRTNAINEELEQAVLRNDQPEPASHASYLFFNKHSYEPSGFKPNPNLMIATNQPLSPFIGSSVKLPILAFALANANYSWVKTLLHQGANPNLKLDRDQQQALLVHIKTIIEHEDALEAQNNNANATPATSDDEDDSTHEASIHKNEECQSLDEDEHDNGVEDLAAENDASDNDHDPFQAMNQMSPSPLMWFAFQKQFFYRSEDHNQKLCTTAMIEYGGHYVPKFEGADEELASFYDGDIRDAIEEGEKLCHHDTHSRRLYDDASYAESTQS